jgi:hypothetical protein
VIHRNIQRAEALSWEVWALGAAAVCPHLNTAHFQDSLPDDIWLLGDLAILAKCDAMILTPDWERSSGARAEREFAEQRGIPVFEDLADLNGWLKGQAKAEEQRSAA